MEVTGWQVRRRVPEQTEQELQRALRDGYRIEHELGAGGMGTVFLAEDLRHGRKVAVKVLRPEIAASMGTERFLREIRIAAGLQHPNILSLIDSGDTGKLLYYVMPYVAASTLRVRLARDGELPIDEALRTLREISDALAYAHGRGIVHRDIKPENVLFMAGHVQLADFGIAKALGELAAGVNATAGGVATLTAMSLTAKKHNIKAKYAGDAAFKMSIGKVIQVVGK